MVELVPLLGTIAVLLTLIGSYRLFGFFFDSDPVFAGLFAVAVTVIFLIVLDALLLLIGILVLIVPVLALVYYSDATELFSLDPSSLFSSSRSSSSDSTNSGSTVECSNCGEANSVTNRHCDSCGELI